MAGVLDRQGQWFSPGTPVSSTNKIDCHDITKILLKVALNTIPPTFINNCVVRILIEHCLCFLSISNM